MLIKRLLDDLGSPIPELSVLLVSDQQRTIVHVYRNGEAYDVEFSYPSRVDWMPP